MPGADWGNLTRIALGFILGTAGLLSLGLAIAQWRRGTGRLWSFGFLTFLYGASFLLQSPVLQPLFGLSREVLIELGAFIAYTLPVAGLYYAEHIRGHGWHGSLRRARQLSVLVAVALFVNVLLGRPIPAVRAYGIYLTLVMLVLLPHVIFWRQRDRIESLARTLGTGTLVISIVHDNLAAFGLLPFPVSLQLVGVTAFLLSLGYVTVRQTFADQRELAAVERELNTARGIQTSILPRSIPIVTGLDMAVRYTPARSVAGDVYGFLSVDEHRVGVLVADVTGHGVPAALIASMTSVLFTAQKELVSDPARLLASMNGALAGRFDSQFVTAVYVYIDTERRCARYGVAGHPPPILRRADGHLERLSEGGLILGVFPEAIYTSADTEFGPGDRLVLYTDGLSDAAASDGRWFGDEELSAFLTAHEPDGATEFASALVNRLAAWTGRVDEDHPFEDDVTVVVIDATRSDRT